MGDPRDRSRPFRVMPPAPETPHGTPSLAPGLLPGVIKSLPPWGRVVVGAALAIGLGSGAGAATVVKVFGIQTTSQAAADTAALKAEIGAVVKAQQTSDGLAAASRAEMTAAIEAIRKSTVNTNTRLAAIARQLGQKRAPRVAPEQDATP